MFSVTNHENSLDGTAWNSFIRRIETALTVLWRQHCWTRSSLLNGIPVSVDRDGSYSWVENTVSNLLTDLEVRGIVMHQRDINERRLAEAERQHHADELARSNVRLEEFAYMVAHDLREPLRAIATYTELLVRKTPMDANSKQMATFITTGVSRMSTLITICSRSRQLACTSLASRLI